MDIAYTIKGSEEIEDGAEEAQGLRQEA